MNNLRAGLLISFLSITIAEFATGSTPLTDIVVNPASFFLFSIPSLLGLYGCGVLLIREATIKWRKGWPTTLLMGMAYGIMEEGVSVHTFFAPVNHTVGVLGDYGRVMGLNFTWAIMITLFHSVFSISLPIMISGRIWPELRTRRLLTKRSGILVLTGFAVTVTILDTVAPYRPSPAYIILLLVAAAILAYAAIRLPVTLFTRHIESSAMTRYLLLGLVFFPFILIFSTNQRFLPPIFPDIEMVTVAILIYWQFETRVNLHIPKQTAFMSLGLLAPVIAFGIVVSIISNPLGLVAIVALVYLLMRIFRATSASSQIIEF